MSHDFAERVNFSHGVALDEGIINHLLRMIPNATGARRTESSSTDDRNGTDLWIDRRGLPSVSVDFKHREKSYDDICIETWSVDRPGKKPIIGWTMDRNKRTDLVLVDIVVDALRSCPWNASVEHLAVAAIEAVFAHERCAVCREPMRGPTICDVCAREKTPVLTAERRRA